MIRAHHVALVVLGLAMLGLLLPHLAHAAPDQRRRTTFQQQDGVTCTPVPGVGLRCSDGRVSTTVRASECMERAGDVWTTRPANTACVDDDGMQAYQGFTQYITNSTDFSAWTIQAGVTRTQNADGSWRFCYPSGANGTFATEASLSYSDFAAGDAMTGAVEVRAVSGVTRVNLTLEGGAATVVGQPPPSEWVRLYGSGTKGAGASRVYLNANAGAGGCIDFRQTQLTKTAVPMPRHDCGATACSRATETHTISTTGWPTDKGEVCITADVSFADTTVSRWMVDGRSASAGGNSRLFLDAASNQFRVTGSGGLNGPNVTPGVHSYCAGTLGEDRRLRLNGAVVASTAATTPLVWAATASVGSSYNSGAHINGHIRRLSWSAK